jgi:hypothetical protein
MNKGNKMKLITTLFLILTSTSAFSSLKYAESCSFNEVEGKKIVKSYGRVLKQCFNKNILPETYETSVSNNCSNTHVAGVREEIFSGYQIKECISKASLGEIYSTDRNGSCTRGYSTDGVLVFDDYVMPSKICTRYF